MCDSRDAHSSRAVNPDAGGYSNANRDCQSRNIRYTASDSYARRISRRGSRTRGDGNPFSYTAPPGLAKETNRAPVALDRPGRS